MEWQMVLWNCNRSEDEHVANPIGNSTGCGQDMEATTSKGREPIRPDQHGEDDDIPSEDDNTRALKWLPIWCKQELAMELVSHLSGI
jgi:hypothetical protein